jgi:hypothetical protein
MVVEVEGHIHLEVEQHLAEMAEDKVDPTHLDQKVQHQETTHQQVHPKVYQEVV